MTEKELFSPINTNFELRQDPTTEQFNISGFFVRFDEVSHNERIAPTAFNRTLSHGHDVRMLINHDGVPVARTTSGTMRLTVRDEGLWAETVGGLDEANPTVQEIKSAISRGDLSQASFAFRDLTPKDDRFDDQGVRVIREVELFEISIVTFPWYPTTSVNLNSAPLASAFAALSRGKHLTAAEAIAVRSALEEMPDAPTETEAPVAHKVRLAKKQLLLTKLKAVLDV